LTSIEHVFDHGPMAQPVVLEPRTRADARRTVEQLRERMRGMQDGLPRLPVPTAPELAGLVELRTGGAYRVDSTGLALALLAPPSQAGGWTALVGVDDLGVEAAAEAGLDLDRTVVVPVPGEHWVEVTAALVDVLPMVLLRPPAGLGEKGLVRTAGRLGARLRKRSATLLAQGPWPGCEARLSVAASRWVGVEEGGGDGHGRLRARQVVLACRRGSAPAQHATVWLPAPDAPLRPVPEHAPPLEVRTG
jgi:hypothetical protein